MLPFPSEQPGDDTEAHFTYVRALSNLSVDCSSGDRVVVLLRPGWGSTCQKEKEKKKEEKKKKREKKKKEEKKKKRGEEKRRGEKVRKCKISEERRRGDERREERERLEARKKKEDRKEKSEIEIRTAGILKKDEKKIWIEK